jgi:hypothetical protein
MRLTTTIAAIKSFKGKSSNDCVYAFLDLVKKHLRMMYLKNNYSGPLSSAGEASTGEAPSSAAHQDLFATKFLETNYATNMLDLIINYSELYDTRGQYHSPYTAIVQASMTCKSRTVKEIATMFIASLYACERLQKPAILIPDF